MAKRGSGQVSLKDIDKIDVLTKQIQDLRKETGSQATKSIDHLTHDIEKLRQHTIENDNDDDKDKEK